MKILVGERRSAANVVEHEFTGEKLKYAVGGDCGLSIKDGDRFIAFFPPGAYQYVKIDHEEVPEQPLYPPIYPGDPNYPANPYYPWTSPGPIWYSGAGNHTGGES